MIIAVSMRAADSVAYHEPRDAISHEWIEFLQSKAITPVPISNALRQPSEYMRSIRARGLILTGGEDLGPLPGEPGEQSAGNSRDAVENELLECALGERIPVFGVCRGLHLVNVHFGGGLERDLGPSANHVNVMHRVEIVASPSDHVKDGEGGETNSYHGQGVVVGGVAPDLRVFAVAADDVVEGLYHPSLPVVAVQWHPERPNPASQLDEALFEDWLARCE
jgi:putative glutamine amidotransferase